MSMGLGIGFVDEMKDVEKDMEGAIPSDFDIAARTKITRVADDNLMSSPVYSGMAAFGGNGQVVVNVPLFMDGKEITAATGTIQSGNNLSYRRALGVT